MNSILCIPHKVAPWDTCFMDTWRERAKHRMRDLGVSQERLAEQFGMTPAGMQKWLAGTRQPSFEDINTIADHLKVTRTWLAYGVEPNDSIDGLSTTAQAIVRKIIHLERLGRLPESLWSAIDAMINAVAPLPDETEHIKSAAPAKNGTTN